MNEEQQEDNSKKIGDHYSEFSLDEFKNSSFTVVGLCNAIKADHYKLQFAISSLNSTEKLNELLQSTDFFKQVIQKKDNINWSIDVKHLISLTSHWGKFPFSEIDKDGQIYIKRLNRLLLEEAYPNETPPSSNYFIPSGLSIWVEQFECHYDVAKGDPILIVGETGVGKSLFLHIFEKLYRENHQDEKKYPIVKGNCAHFGGDTNMVRSELFGHMKGSFTNATYNKKGLVEMANGGVLILEEIGDLPLETQALLLTFIETGEYYRVGDGKEKSSDDKKDGDATTEKGSSKELHSGKPRRAKVQIVGLTNREEFLREDFRHRFFPFYVPPLHERRGDILYYLYAMFPYLFKAMTHYEVLTLLAYNWPGNVREIERVGRILQRDKEWQSRLEDLSFETKKVVFESRRFHRLTEQHRTTPYKTINAFRGEELHADLKKNGVDVVFLEQILNKHKVGLTKTSDANVFSDNLGYAVYDKKRSTRYGIRYSFLISDFDETYRGFFTFCKIFQQNNESSTDIFELTDFHLTDPSDYIKYPNKEKDRYNELFASIVHYLKKRHELTSEQTNIQQTEKDRDIFSLKVADYIKPYYKLYYQTLLVRTQGNQKKAAALAGLRYQTFRDDLKKYGITAGRKIKIGLTAST